MVKISNIKTQRDQEKARAGGQPGVFRPSYKGDKTHGKIKNPSSRRRKPHAQTRQRFLSKAGYDVIEAGDGEQAVDTFYAQKDIALIILDVMMPKMDGWQVCREIRQNSKVPIIMLTAKSEERDELLGFDLGVDEYISKPFSPKILVARVEAILRRSGKTGEDDVLEAGGIRIDKAAHMASIDGKPMELSYKEFELLTYFLENQGIALSREKS